MSQPTAIRTEVLTENGGPPEFLIGGRNPAFARVLDVVDAVAPSDSTVLIQGESGTGKDIIARLIHQKSNRSDGPWVAVDCGSIPRELMESELFGHEKGAFTGALAKKDGLCQAADGGTLFLDEIGELPLNLQVKLLRVLQSGLVRPVGSTSSLRASFRVFAATNRDLREEVRKGQFRLDLFYRLNVINITLPALRERPEDIPDLVDSIAVRLADRGVRNSGINDETMAILQQHSWPGNIRELENVVERILLFFPDGNAPVDKVLAELQDVQVEDEECLTESTSSTGSASYPLNLTLKEVEEIHIRRLLWHHRGNKTRAADALGINVKTLYNRMKAAGLTREHFMDRSDDSRDTPPE